MSLNRSILQFAGQNIESPLPPQITVSDVDYNSDSDANGDLHRNRVNVKRKIKCEWGPISWDKISTILRLVKSVSFSCNYPDPETGVFEERVFYVSDRVAPTAYYDEELETIMWQGLQFTIVEM